MRRRPGVRGRAAATSARARGPGAHARTAVHVVRERSAPADAEVRVAGQRWIEDHGYRHSSPLAVAPQARAGHRHRARPVRGALERAEDQPLAARADPALARDGDCLDARPRGRRVTEFVVLLNSTSSDLIDPPQPVHLALIATIKDHEGRVELTYLIANAKAQRE